MARARLKVSFVESFSGGSHRAFAEGFARHSQHAVEVTAFPARFWKWRMRGAALEAARLLSKRVQEGEVEVLFATGLLDLAHLTALLPRRVPSLLYFHENQVSYPPRPGNRRPGRDLQYAFTNLASALAADRVVFNSAFQRDAFFAELEPLLRRMPDLRPLWALERIRAKTEVASLGVEVSDIERRVPSVRDHPLILWNHRWEYDKDPGTFFRVLGNLQSQGVPFRVAVAGESFSHAPRAFDSARKALGDRVVHWGYVPERREYVRLLSRADMVVSTALQENFGVSIVEAAYAGAHPLVPRRLSYPEILPPSLHDRCIYDGTPELEDRLGALLTGRLAPVPPASLREAMSPYAWPRRIGAFDDLICQVFGGKRAESVV